MHIAQNTTGQARLGLIVSKRVMAKAVTRNFVKRHIREVFRLQANQLPALDFVVRARRKISTEEVKQAREALLITLLQTSATRP